MIYGHQRLESASDNTIRTGGKSPWLLASDVIWLFSNRTAPPLIPHKSPTRSRRKRERKMFKRVSTKKRRLIKFHNSQVWMPSFSTQSDDANVVADKRTAAQFPTEMTSQAFQDRSHLRRRKRANRIFNPQLSHTHTQPTKRNGTCVHLFRPGLEPNSELRVAQPKNNSAIFLFFFGGEWVC